MKKGALDSFGPLGAVFFFILTPDFWLLTPLFLVHFTAI